MSTGFDRQLAQEIGTYRGMYGGAQVPRQLIDFNFAESGLGGAFASPLLPMLLQPAINAFFGHSGIAPAQWSPTQGLADQWRGKAFWQAHSAAMATASAADRETYVQMLRGIAQMQGTPWGLEQQRSANVIAGDLAYMSPFLAQAMPEVFDEIHGTRGSATVMASFLHRAGLTGVDPVTGRTGISGASSGVLANEMHRRFFGVNADLSAWRGLSAGRVGAMYDELQTRGLMGMSIGAMTRDEQVAAMTGSVTSRQDALRLLQAQDPEAFRRLAAPVPGAANLTGEDQIRKLTDVQGVAETAIRDMQKNPDQFATLLRQFDATQIGNRLKNMSGAVSAMREIFGDLGQPNAPMAQLIEGLNSLTQGGLATMNAADLERNVRTLQVTARTSGMGMAGLVGLMTQGTAAAIAMGLDPSFGRISAQGAAEFGAAYAHAGHADIPGWGRVDRDKLTLMDQQLRLRAADSPMAQRLGAAMRMVETLEAAHVGGGPAVTGPLAEVAKAVREHRDTFTNERGQQESLNMNEGRIRQVAGMAGMDQSVAMDFLRSTAASQEMIAKYDLTDTARRAQPAELREMMAQTLYGTVRGRLQAAGVTDPKEAHAITDVVTKAQAEALFSMPVETRLNDATRNQFMADATRAAVMAQFAAQGMTTAAAEARFEQLFPREQLATMIAGGVGRIQQQFTTNPIWKGYRGMNAALDVNNRDVERRRAIVRQENAADVAIGTALSGLGQAGPIARFMDEVQAPSASIGEAVQKFIGGVPAETIRMALANIDPNNLETQAGAGAKARLGLVLGELAETNRLYEANRTSAGTPEERLARSEKYLAKIRALEGGRGLATVQLRTELFNAHLIGAGADDATVQYVANQVLRKEIAAPEEVQRVVGALAASGATADNAALDRQQAALFAKESITDPTEITKILGGMTDKLSIAGRDALNVIQMARGGMRTLGEGAGIAIGAKVGEKQFADVADQRALLEADLAKPLPTTPGAALDEATSERRRHAENVIDRGWRVTDQLLGNTASMESLGAGGFAPAQESWEKKKKMMQIAANLGLNLGEVLSDTVPDKEKLSEGKKKAIIEIQKLNADVKKADAEILRQWGLDTKDRQILTKDQREQLKKFQTEKGLTPEASQRQLIKDIAASGVGDSDEATIARTMALFGKGAAGDYDQFALSQQFEARKQLKDMARQRGIDIDQLKQEAEGGSSFAQFFGFGKLTSEEVARVKSLRSDAGELREKSGSVEGALKAIHVRREAIETEARGKAGTVGVGKMTCTGTVILKRDGVTLDVAGMGVDLGSTPVVT